MEKIDNFYSKHNGSYFIFEAIFIAVVTVIVSSILYIQIDWKFNIIGYYLSDLGSIPLGTTENKFYLYAIVFNSGMFVVSLFRIIVSLFLIRYLILHNCPKKLAWLTFGIGLIATSGSLIVSAVPYSVSYNVHLMGAFLLFIGATISGTLLTFAEFKSEEIPKILPISIIINVLAYGIFATLLFGTRLGLPERLPCVWEWIAFLTSLTWLAIHGIYTYNNP